MTYKAQWNRVWLLAASLLLVSAYANHAQAQVKPFKVNGEGLILGDVLLAPGATAPHFAIGRGSAGLGRYFGIGAVQVDNPTTGEFSSAVPFRFFKWGGTGVLAFQYGRTDPESGASPPAEEPGIVMVVPTEVEGLFKTVWLAEFNPVPAASGGKFDNIFSGSFFMLAESDPFAFGVTEDGIPFIPANTPYGWSGEGTLVFEK